MITKNDLIDFIDKNFDELKLGGCADWTQLEHSKMTVKEFDDCEKVLTKLLTTTHKGNSTFKSVWAVWLVGSSSDKDDIFGSDPWGESDKIFHSCADAEKFAWREVGIVIEYVVDRTAYNAAKIEGVSDVKRFINDHGYIARRVIIDHTYGD